MDFKNYSVFENIKYTHKYILQDYQFTYWIKGLIVILANIFTTFMLTLLPAYIVNLLIQKNSIIKILINLTIYSLILYTITILYKRLDQDLKNKINTNRMFKCLDYYDNIMKTDYVNIDITKNKEIFNAGLASYMDGFHEGFSHMIIDSKVLIQSFLGLTIYSLFIAKINIFMALTLIVISSVSIFINVLNEKWINKNKEKWFKIDTKLNYLSIESISLKNAKDVRLYNIRNWFMSTFEYLIILRQEWSKKEIRIFCIVNISERCLNAIKYGIAYFIVFNKLKHGLGISEFILVIGLILGVNTWIIELFKSIKYLQLNNIIINNSRLALEIKKASSKNKKSILGNNLGYEIRFENVSFSFPDSKEKIFNKFNLTINKGENVALVGTNGAGKTTLVKLICGLYTPTEGNIYLNGQNINSYNKEDYLSKFSIMFQDFKVLAVSIAENIACCINKKIDYEKVNKCIKLSGLSEKIISLKKGVDTNMLKELDNEGVVFSGGETQKLMLARCLYKDSPIIILDEPTAALDAIAESEMYEKYNLLRNKKTSIFISHRLSSTKFCDRIIMLKKGRVIEEGTHEKLLKLNKEYANMFNIQASYYREENIDNV